MAFTDFGLDDRLLAAIFNSNLWETPTAVQEAAIPLVLSGRDTFIKGRTGCGKTGAYTVPVIQKVLQLKQQGQISSVRFLILCPSKELCRQTYVACRSLSTACSKFIRVVDISENVGLAFQAPLLLELPDIVVSTPSRVIAHVKKGNLSLDNLELVVIDEADLMFSFNFELELKEIQEELPKHCQKVLMSATLTSEVAAVKKLFLHNPVLVKLNEGGNLPDSSKLTQYHIKCSEDDKYLLMYALPKLNLLFGRTLIFVNSIDKAYKLKIFFTYIGINSCVLNCHLPVASRCHIIDQFNQGLFPYIISTDDSTPTTTSSTSHQSSSGGSAAKDKRSKKGKKNAGASAEVEVDDSSEGLSTSRGLDFQLVSNVINFDFPSSPHHYIHRVGRTARAQHEGVALSFVTPSEEQVLSRVQSKLGKDSNFKPYQFKMEDLDKFRYRVKDAMRAATSAAVKEARVNEIRREIASSSKLKGYFDENPADLKALRHDKPTKMKYGNLSSELRHIPDYLVPASLKSSGNFTAPSLTNNRWKKNRKQQMQNRFRHKGDKRKNVDPLQTFSAKKRRNTK